MTRRDTIILAVLLNTGLLAILFVLAITPDEEKIGDSPEVTHAIVEAGKIEKVREPLPVIVSVHENKADEVDNVLKDFAETIRSSPSEMYITSYNEPKEISASIGARAQNISSDSYSSPKQDYIEITVKNGDILGRIAKANNTTVSSIRNINHLIGDKLKVGQILKIPAPIKQSQNIVTRFESGPDEGSSGFYSVQEGDNPWKISKRFHVSVQELLLLNGLDEAKARNLRPGDRIRVR